MFIDNLFLLFVINLIAPTETFHWNQEDYNAVVNVLEDGDIICRCKDNFISHCVKYTSFDHRFSHVGIIEKKNGKCYVIHSIGNTNFWGSQTIKTSLKNFTENSLDWEIYRIARIKTIRQKISQVANTKIGAKYDYWFSLQTDDRLYCSELVLKATNQALQEDFYKPNNLLGYLIMPVNKCYNHPEVYSIVHLYHQKVRIDKYISDYVDINRNSIPSLQ